MRPTLYAVPSLSGEAGAGTAQRAGVGQMSALASITPTGACLVQLYGVLKAHTEVGLNVPHLLASSLVEQIEETLGIGDVA